MTVWAEEPRDGGSAVWGCSTCDDGGWCWEYSTALAESRTHAKGHGEKAVVIGGPGRGRRINHARDIRLCDLRASGLTMQQVAEQVGMSVSGVLRALRRLDRAS